MKSPNRIPARLKGTLENPYAEIDGYATISQIGTDTIHIVGNQEAYILDWKPACGVGFPRESVLSPHIGYERSRPVCFKCRKAVVGCAVVEPILSHHTGECCGLAEGWYWGVIGLMGGTSALHGPYPNRQDADGSANKEIGIDKRDA
jgi:hypothetical protein